jgi:hypothetical protein
LYVYAVPPEEEIAVFVDTLSFAAVAGVDDPVRLAVGRPESDRVVF